VLDWIILEFHCVGFSQIPRGGAGVIYIAPRLRGRVGQGIRTPFLYNTPKSNILFKKNIKGILYRRNINGIL